MSTHFEIQKTKIEGLMTLQRKILSDSRGYLERLFCQHELEAFLKGKTITQINHTMTATAGTVRGMHFQYPPHAEIKFVSCIRGEVLDVAVDLRKNSSTFLHHHAELLSTENYKTLLIPEGFAHGFQTLTTDCEMLYFHTADYNAESEGALNATDPRLNINWQLDISEQSDRDRDRPMINDAFEGVLL